MCFLFQFVNKKFEEETGLKVKEIVGKKMNRYFTPRIPVAKCSKRSDLKITTGFLPDTQASIEEVTWEHVHQKLRVNKVICWSTVKFKQEVYSLVRTVF